jgi:tetratricopeptide (TPR) repeat protein
MTDESKLSLSLIFPAILLLTACVATRDDNAAGFSKGDQYLRYGVEAFAAGQPTVAKSRFNWALGIFEREGNLDGQIRAHINLAEQAFQTRDLSGASDHIKRAEELVIQSGKAEYKRRILLIQSSIALSQRDYDQAQITLNKLLGGFQEQSSGAKGDAIYISALINRTALSRDQDDGEFEKWVKRLKQSIDTTQDDCSGVNGQLLRFEAELSRRNGDLKKVGTCFENALKSYRPGLDDIAIGSTLLEWARLDIEQGRMYQASQKLRRSILLKDAGGDIEGVIEGMQLLVKVESERGRTDDADVLRELVQVLRNQKSSYGYRLPEVIGSEPHSDQAGKN